MPDLTLTVQDFIDANWEAVIANANKHQYSEYERLLGAKAKELSENGGNGAHIEVFKLLSGIFSMVLDPDDPDQPFRPAFVWGNTRGMVLDDITDYQFNVLAELVPTITNVEAKARICDILWVGKRDHRMALDAVECYLASATILEDPTMWVPCAERIERAMRIALYLGRQKQPLRNVISHIETVLDRYDGTDPLFLSCRLMELLLELKVGNPSKYSSLAEKVALSAERESDWNRARAYWIIKSKWERLAGNEVAAKESLIRNAETFVKEALKKTTDNNPGFFVAATHIQSAIDAYRRIGGQQSRINDLHRLLLEYEEKAMAELKTISVPFDPTEEQEKARNAVKGKSFVEALLVLAMMANTKKNDIRSQVINEAKQFPLHYLFTGVTVNEKGKVVHRQPDMMSDDPQEREAAIKAEMFRRASMVQQYSVTAYVDPARQQILLEHYVRESDFLELAQCSAYVPPGRERIFARGLHAGLKGDFLVSTHLLIPQIENSIRYVLEQRGVITSSLNKEGIQEEKDINTLLYEPELKDVLGEDMVFDLQCLLVERVGSNMRNRVAHGLLSDWDFSVPQAEYVWWIVLKLCCIGWLSAMKQQKDFNDTHGGEATTSEQDGV